jgi:hypothetical protein
LSAVAGSHYRGIQANLRKITLSFEFHHDRPTSHGASWELLNRGKRDSQGLMPLARSFSSDGLHRDFGAGETAL